MAPQLGAGPAGGGGFSVGRAGFYLAGRQLPTTLALVLSLAPERSVSVLCLPLPNRLSRKASTSLPSPLFRGREPEHTYIFPNTEGAQGLFLFGRLKGDALEFCTQYYPAGKSLSSSTHPQRLPRSPKFKEVSPSLNSSSLKSLAETLLIIVHRKVYFLKLFFKTYEK